MSSSARIDPEDPLGIPAAPMVQWYRVDVSRRLGRVLLSAGTVIAIGSIAVSTFVVLRARSAGVVWVPGTARAMLGRVPDSDTEIVFGLFGLLFAFVAGLVTLYALGRMLGEERYLAMRVDGLLHVDGPQRRFVAWDDIEDAVGTRDQLTIALTSGETWIFRERLSGIEWPELGKLLLTIRRKALFGLYHY